VARIVSVTFETEAHSQAGHFSIPRRVADFLGIGDDDRVELRVLCEGLKLEFETQLRSGLEVYHRLNDPATFGLQQIPANSLLIVTVSHPHDEALAEVARVWDRITFIDSLTDVGITRRVAAEVLDACLAWAQERGITVRWGSAKSGSVLFSLDDGRLPSSVGHKQRFFALWTTGGVELQFSSMAPPFLDALRSGELQEKLNVIDGIEVRRNTGYPNFSIQVIAEVRRRNEFLATQDWVLAETRRWLGTQSDDGGQRRRWSRDDLMADLEVYEEACLRSGMKPISVHSYVDYATRYVKWLFGEYRPRNSGSTTSTAREDPFSVSELFDHAKAFKEELKAAGLRPAAIETYYRHAMFFIRWLGGDFNPGGRLGNRG
jgi:hypothetical protein